MSIETHLARIVPVILAMVPAPCAVALGGAHAKGIADAQSDLDLYVFAESWPAADARDAAVAEALPEAGGLRSWSGGVVQAGTDFTLDGLPVEIWFRHIAPVRDAVIASVAGEVRREFVTWTPNGFYRHCTLSDLASLKPLHDAGRVLSPLLETLSHYPPALKAALVGEGLASLRFWRDNMHLDTALVRSDAFYLQSIMQQIATDLLQALFALNETYYPGDKKMAALVRKLPAVPADFAARFDYALLGTGVRTQEDWRARFAGLFALGAEIEALAGEGLREAVAHTHKRVG